MLTRIKEALPVISVALVLLAFFDLYFYYSLFGIEIYNYIEVSEIIFSFSTIYLYVIVISTYFIAGWGLVVARVFFKRKGEPMPAQHPMSPVTRKFFLVFFIVSAIGSVLAMLLPLLSDSALATRSEWASIFIIYFFALCIYMVLFHYDPEKLQQFNANPNLKNLSYALMTLLFVLGILYRDYIRYLAVINGFPNRTVQLSIEGSKSFHSYKRQAVPFLWEWAFDINIAKVPEPLVPIYYLGSTQKYFFFWRGDSSMSIILARANITRVSSKESNESQTMLEYLDYFQKQLKETHRLDSLNRVNRADTVNTK
jgi:hypothetical protein